MSERKVLTKYYPPDFDPSAIQRRRGGKENAKLPTIRMAAPEGARCSKCGESIGRGRRFNARKEKLEEQWFGTNVIRFYIKCPNPLCAQPITFRTDPRTTDYIQESGTVKAVLRQQKEEAEKTEQERLDELVEQEQEQDAMAELEQKAIDAKTEMAIADALDDMRHRNAARERLGKEDGQLTTTPAPVIDEEVERFERNIEEQARLAFQSGTGEKIRRLVQEDDAADTDHVTPGSAGEGTSSTTSAASAFKRQVKRKRDVTSQFGIKKKPTLVQEVLTKNHQGLPGIT